MAVAVPGNRAAYFDSVRSYFPSGTKALRACIQCRVIMEKNQFVELGCPGCPDLKMQENENRVIGCTTQNFEGYMANIRPGGFSTRFTGLEKRMPGFYALVVRGEIPPPMDDMDMDLPGLVVRDGSESPTPAELEEELFPDRPSQPTLPKAKKRKTELPAVNSQPPSRDSSVSDADHGNMLAKALDFADSDSDASADARAKDQVTLSASEHTGTSHSETDARSRRVKDQVAVSASERTGTSHSETDARSRRPMDQTAPSGSERTGTSHSETDARGRPKDQIIPSASERTGTSLSETDASKRAKEAANPHHDSSANESQKSGKSARSHDSKQSDKSRKSAQSAQSGQTATSERSRSVAIIEPEVDTEFDRAPE